MLALNWALQPANGTTGETPAEGLNDDLGPGASLLRGKAEERPVTIQAGDDWEGFLSTLTSM